MKKAKTRFWPCEVFQLFLIFLLIFDEQSVAITNRCVKLTFWNKVHTTEPPWVVLITCDTDNNTRTVNNCDSMLLSAISFTHNSIICWSWLTTDIISWNRSLEGAIHKLSGETGSNSFRQSVVFSLLHAIISFFPAVLSRLPHSVMNWAVLMGKNCICLCKIICCETRAGTVLWFGKKGCSTGIISFNSEMQFSSCCLDTAGDLNMWSVIHITSLYLSVALCTCPRGPYPHGGSFSWDYVKQLCSRCHVAYR